MVAYKLGEQESKLVVTVASDETDAKQRLKKLEEHFTKTGDCQDGPELGPGGMRGKNSFEGSVMAVRQGRYLVMVVNPGRGGEELLRGMAAGLE